jgi:galactitol PTS system EIIA component
MGKTAMIHRVLIQTGLDLAKSEEVIGLLADLLLDGGYVKEGFKPAVLEREGKFPTGLSTGDNGFAIPHTDQCYVKKTGIAVGILNHPVRFAEMGDPQHAVEVDIVIMPAIRNPDQVVVFLKELCLLLQDKTLVAGLHACANAEEVESILKKRLKI